MSAQPPRASRTLPERPDLRHLKDQAKDLLRAGGAASLSAAQLQIARGYGFASWPKLKAHVDSLHEAGQLKDAITANDLERVKALMTPNPALHRAGIGYHGNGPLTWAAECRGAAPTAERLAIARWMLENGSDVHQGGDGPLMRAALNDERIPMMELLVAHGAGVNARWDGRYPIVFAPCETLQPRALRWLIEQGADLHAVSPEFGACAPMLIATYWRNPEGKHACLEVLADAGFEFPDTAPMAIHRGRIDLLEACLARYPALLARRFDLAELFPAELGIVPDAGLHFALLAGATLLHMAVEYHETEIAKWLIEHGADVNATSAIDADGFGGHTPLFHATITPFRTGEELARLLLDRGADPNARASLRLGRQKLASGQWQASGEHDIRDVTPIGLPRAYLQPPWINEAAMAAIREYGGG